MGHLSSSDSHHGMGKSIPTAGAEGRHAQTTKSGGPRRNLKEIIKAFRDVQQEDIMNVKRSQKMRGSKDRSQVRAGGEDAPKK